MKKFLLSILPLSFLFLSCEEDTLTPLHPLEGRYKGEVQLFKANGNASTAEDIILDVERTNGDTLLLDFENVTLEGIRLNDYTGLISNNSSMILPAQSIDGEEQTGQGSVNASEEMEIILKRLQDGSDVVFYTGAKQ
ncbi:MAG TPA: hypothetical protein VJ917_04405 [Saprospiraceae bacterium]|nr:hypothetical protein [Saprospiraceae bacterium]